MNRLEELLKIFPAKIQNLLRDLELDFEKLQEIRLRANLSLLLIYDGREILPGEKESYLVSSREIQETLEMVGRYSLYAFEEELRQGFLTIQGGHRIGVAGRTIMEGDKVRNLKYISFLNVRLAHQVKGCGDEVLPFLYREDGQVCQTLLISPPRCGKTTLLRDLIRQISDGAPGRRGYTVGVVDERSEIAGCYLGVPSNDLGVRTDVMDCCPKVEGMMMLVRSMSPEVVAVDEIGNEEEAKALETVLHSGCRLLATVHGNGLEDILKKPLLEKLAKEQIFERYVILHNAQKAGQVQQILDGQGNVLYKGEGRET